MSYRAISTNCMGTVEQGMSIHMGTISKKGTHSHSMSNMGSCMLLLSNQAQHSMKLLYFFLTAILLTQLQFQPFLVSFQNELVHRLTLISYQSVIPFVHFISHLSCPPALHFLIGYTFSLIISFFDLFALQPIEQLFISHLLIFYDFL